MTEGGARGSARAATLVLVAVIVAAAIAEVAFRLRDVRAPSDGERFYVDLADVYWKIRAGERPTIAYLWKTPGAWLVTLQASLLSAIGRSARVFAGASLAAHLAVLVAVAASARRLAGAWGAVAATALIAAMPWLFLEARGGGVAVVEAALVAGALALLVADRGMARAWTAPAVAGLGALALMLRDEAHWFVWPLGILLFSRGRRWGRVLLVLVAWGVAGAPAVFRIADAALLSWRGGLESRVDPGSVSTILRLATSGAVGLVGLAGIGLAVVVGARRVRAGDRPDAVVFVGIAWVAGSALAHAYFRQAPDFSVLPGVAFALGAGWGLAAWHPRAALAPLGSLAIVLATQALPREQLKLEWPLVPSQAVADGLRGRWRPHTRWGAREVAALFDATCPSEAWHSCRVVVEQGLFAPASSEFGLLELFLLAEERVELRTVHEMEAGRWREYKVHALALYDCGQRDARWRQRVPDSTKLALELVDSQGLEPAFARSLDESCFFAWMTPGGQVARPERLPASPRKTPWSIERVRTAQARFVAENREAASRRGRSSVYVGRDRPVDPPAAFREETAAAERAEAIAALPESAAPAPAKGPAEEKKPGAKKGRIDPAGAGTPRAPASPR